jgi:hypothetical protein
MQGRIDRRSRIAMTAQDENAHSESVVAIRAKNRFWRAAMRREGGGHENIFIAKIRDSESVRRAFAHRRSVAMTSTRRRMHDARGKEKLAAQAFPAISTNACGGFSRIVRIVSSMYCGLIDDDASRALVASRQHFLKRDAVFSMVLVYSGCVHLDSRMHAAIKPSHYIRRATWPRKLRRQRRRRAQ